MVHICTFRLFTRVLASYLYRKRRTRNTVAMSLERTNPNGKDNAPRPLGDGMQSAEHTFEEHGASLGLIPSGQHFG